MNSLNTLDLLHKIYKLMEREYGPQHPDMENFRKEAAKQGIDLMERIEIELLAE